MSDPQKAVMERYQVILAYDGSQFQGFQRQAKARTVQGVVEAALRKLEWQGKSVLAAGRTDTGVHATGQVITFDLDWGHSPQELQQALNATLPCDVSALQVRVVAAGFHPRHDASARRYRYQLYCQAERNPLLERYAWRVWPVVDLTLLQQAADLLVGEHNLAAFGTPPRTRGSTVRTILEASWKEAAPYLVFEINAHAFLYHMVRRLVYMQVMVGLRKLELVALERALESAESLSLETSNTLLDENGKEGALVHGLAPSQGLILTEVSYLPRAVLDKDNN